MRKKDILKRILAEAVVLSILTEDEESKKSAEKAEALTTPVSEKKGSLKNYLSGLWSSLPGKDFLGKGTDYIKSNKAKIAGAVAGGTLGGLSGYELGKLISSTRALKTLKAALEKEKEASQALKRLRILKSLASSKEAKKLKAAAGDIEKSRLLSYILGAVGTGAGGYAGVKLQPTISDLIGKLKKK